MDEWNEQYLDIASIDEKPTKSWWMQREKKSHMCSFSVTIIHDGTYVMTGDYGTLCLRRAIPHPKNWKEEMLAWARGCNSISYFAEKVCQFGVNQKIRDWDKERALKDIEDYLSEGIEDAEADIPVRRKDDPDGWDESWELYNKLIENKNEFLKDAIWWDNEHEMLNALENDLGDSAWYECEFGIDYTAQFKLLFECFKYWAKNAI